MNKKILIACQCATNKGDRAIAEYLISELSKYPSAQLTLSTTEPELWGSLSDRSVKVIGTGYKRLRSFSKISFINKIVREIEFLFYRFVCFNELIYNINKCFFCKIVSSTFIKNINESDLVIVTGGHHITSIRNKNALFAITYDIALISRFSSRYVLWSQTIGPLDFTNLRIKNFFRGILVGAESIYLRDQNSFACIHRLYGDISNLIKSYDSVFGYGGEKYNNYSLRKKQVGISIFNGLLKAKKVNGYLVDLLKHCLSQGYDVEFFRMEYEQKELDDINRMIEVLPNKERIRVFDFNSTAEEHMNELATCQCFIGYKTHSVIMSLTTATPLLGICYHIKTKDFMKDYGLENYAAIDTEIEEQDLPRLFDTIIKNAKSIHDIEYAKSLEISKTITDDFHNMIKRTINL